MAKVRHGRRYFKQMSLEVAVRNPERYEGILKTFSKFEGQSLNDETILDIYTQLYLDDVVTAVELSDDNLTSEYVRNWVKKTRKHNNEWGFPTGYQAAFTRYLKTLSEFGFIYAQYKQPLQLSPIAKALVDGKISLSESFAIQCMRFWRMSPYRRVLNDFNYFKFIIDAIIELNNRGKHLSYYQFMLSLFSDDGNINDFIDTIDKNKIGADKEHAYQFICNKYNDLDDDHSRVSKLSTAFNDYGNTVFRVLQLTGFITVEYKSIILLSPNKNRIDFYNALKALNFKISEDAKEDERKYFEELGSFDKTLENLVLSFREAEDHSTEGYNAKIPTIISSYGLTRESIEKALIETSSKGSSNLFWFIQAPVKFEFLLTLYVYTYFGDKFIYKPNYICDEAGIPYSHAPGNMGDIEIFNSEFYWLIEATLIRAKNQQINNETVNLFRHINTESDNKKYLTLVAPYIHDDTKLIFNVASLITIFERKISILCSAAQTTEEFVESIKDENYFEALMFATKTFISRFRDMLNSCEL